MIVPTLLLRVKITEGGRCKINLWIPLIVLWLIIIAFMIVLAPIALIICLIWPRGRRYIIAGPSLIGAFWAMRGLEVRVSDGDDGVLVSCK